MKFIKLEDEKFYLKYSKNKPGDKHFKNARINKINDNEYKFSSLLTKDEMTVYMNNPYYKQFSNILDYFIKRFPEFDLHNNSKDYYDLYMHNSKLLVLTCSNNYFTDFDFPIKVNLNKTEAKSFCKSYTLDLDNIYVVACKSYMFEMFYRLMGLDNTIPKEYLNFFDKLDPSKLYNDKFLNDNNIKCKNIIYNSEFINIPIFEKIGENWIFYQHNYEKYKDKIIEQ